MTSGSVSIMFYQCAVQVACFMTFHVSSECVHSAAYLFLLWQDDVRAFQCHSSMVSRSIRIFQSWIRGKPWLVLNPSILIISGFRVGSWYQLSMVRPSPWMEWRTWSPPEWALFWAATYACETSVTKVGASMLVVTTAKWMVDSCVLRVNTQQFEVLRSSNNAYKQFVFSIAFILLRNTKNVTKLRQICVHEVATDEHLLCSDVFSQHFPSPDRYWHHPALWQWGSLWRRGLWNQGLCRKRLQRLQCEQWRIGNLVSALGSKSTWHECDSMGFIMWCRSHSSYYVNYKLLSTSINYCNACIIMYHHVMSSIVGEEVYRNRQSFQDCNLLGCRKLNVEHIL